MISPCETVSPLYQPSLHALGDARCLGDPERLERFGLRGSGILFIQGNQSHLLGKSEKSWRGLPHVFERP